MMKKKKKSEFDIFPFLSLAPFCISRPHRQTYGVGGRGRTDMLRLGL